MITMTLYGLGRTPLTRGKSLTGETWEDTLLRLHRSTLAPDAPPRRVVYMTYQENQTGSPTNMVMLGYGDPAAEEVTDLPMLIHTDPPQF